MQVFQRCTIFILALVLSICMVSCEKKKEGKVLITEQEFVLRKDKENSYTIDARGKIKNVGEVDVKRIVVTGYCRSCSDLWIVGQWVITPEVEKMPHQKDVIGYISVGNEELFKFTEVADLLLQSGQEAPELPEELEIVVESFEAVDG